MNRDDLIAIYSRKARLNSIRQWYQWLKNWIKRKDGPDESCISIDNSGLSQEERFDLNNLYAKRSDYLDFLRAVLKYKLEDDQVVAEELERLAQIHVETLVKFIRKYPKYRINYEFLPELKEKPSFIDEYFIDELNEYGFYSIDEGPGFFDVFLNLW